MTVPAEDTYRTVAGRGRATVAIAGSEFLGLVVPAVSADEAEAFVASVREDHPDATHVVPAYRVREDPFREYESDDGEPSGSAGRPALGVLQGEDLENVAAAVVRWFGGTELGVGGLGRAYARAVSGAVADASVVERRPHETWTVRVAYDDSGTVRGILESAGVDFEAAYEASVSFDVAVPVAEAEALAERLRSATSGRVEIDG